ncbi:MAG: hypothetical protein RSD36_16510 [Terrisporobacter sp.]
MKLIDIIIFIIMYIFISPITTLLHELSHAAMALLFSNDNVYVNIGSNDIRKVVKINRLIINIGKYKHIKNISFGYVNYSEINSKIKNIIIFASGPLMTLFIALISNYILINTLNSKYLILPSIANSIFWISIIQLFATIIPQNYNYGSYRGFTSDGYKILKLIRKSK